jgi:glutathione S-transferase
MMHVFHREGAGRPLRVVWTLEEAGEPYELTVMSREESRGDEHRARHPLGRVPVLEDDEGLMFESGALCLQVADLHPQTGLLPALGTHDRALAYQWAFFALTELEPPLLEASRLTERDPERAAEARQRFDAAAGAVADALDGGEHLVGGRFTVADVLVGTTLLFTTRTGIADELPASLKDYVGGLTERPAFQRAAKRTLG